MERRKMQAWSMMLLLWSFCLWLAPAPLFAVTENRVPERPAIVLAAFGTTRTEALTPILAVRDAVRLEFPEVPVQLAFTSDIVRRRWQARATDAAFLAAHPGLDPEVLTVRGPLAAIAEFQDRGYGTILVQPLHIAAAEEYSDLAAVVDAFNSIRSVKKRNRPLKQVVLARPLLGVAGIEHPYHEDLERVARALAAEVAVARKQRAALVYMGHGNEHFSTGVYLELEAKLRELYPDVPVYFAMVEGFPSFELTAERIGHDRVKRVLLRPFMLVAGVHAADDMAGDGPGSLQNVLKAAGIEVTAELRGLGDNPAIIATYVGYLRDAAKQAGIAPGR